MNVEHVSKLLLSAAVEVSNCSFMIATCCRWIQGRTWIATVSVLLVPFIGLSKSGSSSKTSTDWLTASGFYSQYSYQSGNFDPLPLPAPSADVEIALRFLSVLSLVGSLSNTVEPDPNDLANAQYRIRTAGGGIKLDLPGVFLIGASRAEFKRWGKRKPLNTFIVAEALSLSRVDVINGQTMVLPASRYGAGIDVFPFTQLSHFTFRWLYLNCSGVGYGVFSFGGGITF